MSAHGGPPSLAPRWPAASPPGGGLAKRRALVVGAAVLPLAALVWGTGQLAGAVFGGGWPAVGLPDVAGVLVRLSGHLGDPGRPGPSP